MYITPTGGSDEFVNKNRPVHERRKMELVPWVVTNHEHSTTIKPSNVKSNFTNAKSRVDNIGLDTWLVGGHTITRTKWVFFKNSHFSNLAIIHHDDRSRRQPHAPNCYPGNRFVVLILLVRHLLKRFFWLVVVLKLWHKIVASQNFRIFDAMTMAAPTARRRQSKAQISVLWVSKASK